MINLKSQGSFRKTEDALEKMKDGQIFQALEKYGALGVNALAAATPVESGETSRSWGYYIVRRKGYYSIVWTNSHIDDGRPVAILLQYGHATGTGGYVQGYDYIMPAIRPIFDQIASDMWRVVTA